MRDFVGGFRKKKRSVTVKETIIDKKPEFDDVKEQKEPSKFTKDIDIPTMFFHYLDEMGIQKIKGHWVFTNIKHKDDYLHCWEGFVVRMELLDPDDQFRKDIIVARRMPNKVKRAHALLGACLRLMNRCDVALKRKYKPTDYKPDGRKFIERELSDSDNGSETEDDEDYREA